MKKPVRLSLLGSLLLAALFVFGALLAPGAAQAWVIPCLVQPGITFVTADMISLSNGTVYAVTFNSNVNTVYKWTPPSCNASVVKTFQATDDGSIPEDVKGPVQSARPDIAANANGDIVVAYRFGSTYPYKLFYARKRANSQQFDSPVLVTNNGYAGDIKLDGNGNVHITYYRSSGAVGGFYQRFNASDNSVVGPLQLTPYQDAEPEMDLDSSNNAHIVYEANAGNDLAYRKVLANGTMGGEKTISTSTDAFFPYISVDTANDTHIVWEGRTTNHQAWYRKCDSNGTNCGAPKNLSNSGSNNSLDVHIETCGTVPFVSWYTDSDANGNHVYVSKNLAAGVDISGNISGASGFNFINSADHYLNALYRGANGKLYFTRQKESLCTAPGVHPTPTPTSTVNPNITPTATSTPDGDKTKFDDKDVPPVVYTGRWFTRSGSPSCLYPTPNGTYHAAAPKPKNTISLTFTGIRVKYWFVTGPTKGKAQVLIDDVPVKTVNLRLDHVACKSWASDALSPGQHTIKIQPKGTGTGEFNMDVITITK